MIDENSYAYFALCNDIFSKKAVTNEELEVLKRQFYNDAVHNFENVPLFKLVDMLNNNDLAERVYSAFKQPLSEYYEKLKENDIFIITDTNQFYPKGIKSKLKIEIPSFFYALGDVTLLAEKFVAVTGARNISSRGEKFAINIGETIAYEDSVLVSGGARGCDYIATKSAIKNGGCAIWFLAMPYTEIQKNKEVMNWVDEGKLLLLWDFYPFSKFQSKIALRRNHYIYACGETSFVCQCDSNISGTFSGAYNCLKNRYSDLFIYDNNSSATKDLIKNGAIAILDN